MISFFKLNAIFWITLLYISVSLNKFNLKYNKDYNKIIELVSMHQISISRPFDDFMLQNHCFLIFISNPFLLLANFLLVLSIHFSSSLISMRIFGVNSQIFQFFIRNINSTSRRRSKPINIEILRCWHWHFFIMTGNLSMYYFSLFFMTIFFRVVFDISIIRRL